MDAKSADGNAAAVPFRTVHGVVPSPWIMALPCVIRAPIIALYVDTLRPHDDFLTQLRKLVISVGFIISLAVLLTIVLNNLTVDDSTSAPAILGRFVMGPLFVLVFAGAYAALRLTSASLDAVTAIFIYSLWLSLTVIAISVIDFPAHDALVVLAILAQLLRVPKLGLALGLITVTYIVSEVNDNAYKRGELEYPLCALNGAIMRGALERLLHKLTSLFDFALGLAAIQLQLLESDKLTKQALASSALALEVAERLGQYDTQGAADVIAEVATEDVASPDLIASLTVLVDNLNKYRPHVPNWLLPRVVSSDDDAPRRADDVITDRSTSTRRLRSKKNGAAESDEASLQRTSDTRSERSVGRGDSLLPHRVVSESAIAAAWFRGGVPFASEVTLAFLSFFGVSPKPSGEARLSASVGPQQTQTLQQQQGFDPLSSFVDAVHRLAGQAHAAVHSFIGDTVMLSWNAASRAVQNEAKAARMVARLRHHLTATNSAVTLRGCIVSGSATVQLAGGLRQQQAITISAPSWLPARRDAISSMLNRVDPGVVLLDTATKLASEFAVVTCPFAVASVTLHDRNEPSGGADAPSAPITVRTAAYELLGECADGDDEWMYVLAKTNADATTRDTVSRLFARWQRGEDNAAWLQELGRVLESMEATQAAAVMQTTMEATQAAVMQSRLGDGSETESRLNLLAQALRQSHSSRKSDVPLLNATA